MSGWTDNDLEAAGMLVWDDKISYLTLGYDGNMRNSHYLTTEKGNQRTNLYSNQNKCSMRPNALPGRWRSGGEWISECHNNSNQELSLLELYYNARIRNNVNGERQKFCDSIVDQGGNKRNPIACGGNEPDIWTYNPSAQADQEIEDQIGDLDSEADEIAKGLIAESRKRIIAIVAVILLLIIIAVMVLR